MTNTLRQACGDGAGVGVATGSQAHAVTGNTGHPLPGCVCACPLAETIDGRKLFFSLR